VAQGLKDGFIIREMDAAGAPLDAGRRLWAQTEAIRTALMFGDAGAADLIEAVFATHLDTMTPGLWVDSYDAAGEVQDRTVPASSLYHLMTAFSALLRHDL